METLNKVNRSKEKVVYRISYDEFILGGWLKLVPKGSRVKVEWTSGNGILTVENTPYLHFDEYIKIDKNREGENNGNKNKN